MIDGDGWTRPDLQRPYRGHFAPYLARRFEALRAMYLGFGRGTWKGWRPSAGVRMAPRERPRTPTLPAGEGKFDIHLTIDTLGTPAYDVAVRRETTAGGSAAQTDGVEAGDISGHLSLAEPLVNPVRDEDRCAASWGSVDMHEFAVAALGLGAGALWLLLLVLTDFNAVVVGSGVLAGLIAVERTHA